MATPSRASLIAILVWVKAAGFIIIAILKFKGV